MATINLDRKNGQQNTLGYIITAEKETFKSFHMFEKITYKEFHGENFKLLGLNKKKQNGNLFIEYDDYDFHDINADYVQYVAAYYNKNKNEFPLIIEINRYGTKKFYKCSKLLNSGHDIYKLKTQSRSHKLIEDLITENDLINQTLTYRIEKKENYNNIIVEVKEDQQLGYTICIHKPKISYFKENKSCVLYDKYLFEINKRKENNLYEDNEGSHKVDSIQGMIFDSINVYYRKKDKNDDMPLLVECVGNNKQKFYFSRRSQYENKWNICDLESDEFDYLNLEENEDGNSLKNKLDTIEFQIKHSVLLLLHKKNNYKKGEMDPTVKYNEISKTQRVAIGPDKIKSDTVYVEKIPIDNLNYECHKHNLESYTESKDTKPELIFGLIDFRVLKIFISTRCIEIYDEVTSIPLLYNDKDPLYVYFYKDDHFPLLIKYGNYYYGPKSKEKYFVEWEKISNIENQINKSIVFDQKIIQVLDEINSMLNEIDIHKTSDYGIDDYEYDIDEQKNKDHVANPKFFDFIRISVHKEDFGIYRKFTHKTKNKSDIERFCFNKKSFPKEKLVINEIKANSLSVYYFMYDATTNKENPLVLELQLESNKYKYYILQNDKTLFSEYKHKTSKNSKINNEELNKILEHQNFIFNKVISILLENQVHYRCCNMEKDKKYISFLVKDNHNLCYINSQKKETITEPKNFRFIDVKNININSLIRLGSFILFKHSLNILNLENTLPKNVNLELTRENTNFTINKIIIQNKTIQLKYGKETKERLFKTRAAYVHFYKNDKRPLLVYCNNVIFYPKSTEKYLVEWEATNNRDFFKNYDRNNFFTLLEYKLNEIYYNLNPVYLDKISRYSVLDPFKEPIIEVKSQNFIIFKKFIHTIPDDYKLGVAKYKNHFIIGAYESYEYKSSELECISAYYINNDKEYKYPLLIEFRFKGNKFNDYQFHIYYELISIHPSYKWKKMDIGNLNYNEKLKYTKLLKLSKDLIKDPLLLVQTKNSIHFEEGASPEKIEPHDDHYEYLSSLNTMIADQSETFQPQNIYINMPFQDQSIYKLNLDETNNLNSYIYDIYDNDYEFPKNSYDRNIINSLSSETTNLNESQEINYQRIDLETKRTTKSEQIKTQNLSHKMENYKENEYTLSARAEASVGGADGYSNISTSNLGPTLGGVFGSLFFIGLAAYPAYKFYKKFKIKDMRPIF